jgi:hypothetical protein
MKSKEKSSMGIWPRRQDVAIHGYLVRHNPFERIMWIEKGGNLICHVDNLQQAHRVIAVLTERE